MLSWGKNKSVRQTLRLSLRRDNSISQVSQLMICFSCLYQSLMDTKWFTIQLCPYLIFLWENDNLIKKPVCKMWQNLTLFFWFYCLLNCEKHSKKCTHNNYASCYIFTNWIHPCNQQPEKQTEHCQYSRSPLCTSFLLSTLPQW